MESNEEAEYFRKLVDFLVEKCGTGKGRRILDVGCGAGKYSRAFVRLGSEVVMTDFSEQMLKYAEKACADDPGKAVAVLCDWTSDDYLKQSWSGAFDLVFASMVPGIASSESIRRMNSASRNLCFIAIFAKRTDHMYEAFAKAADLSEPETKLSANHEDIIARIKEFGYTPEVHYVDYGWENLWTVDEAVARYENALRSSGAKELLEHDRLIKAAQEMADTDGMDLDRSDATAAWMLWSVKR